MSTKRVLVTDHIFESLDIEESVLAPLGCEVELAPADDEETLVELAADVVAILVCFAQLSERVIEAASPTCRVISRYGIGFDNIDVAAATNRGIPVTRVPDYCIEEVADHAMALLLGLARSVNRADRDVRAGSWKVPHGTVHRLRGSRLAVIGTGKIGAALIERALPFGLEIVAYDPYREPWDLPVERAETVLEAVAEADLISLHAPLTDETHHLIDAELIDGMRRAPIVVNTSRGPLIDTLAAANALAEGKLRGLGIDVAENEPLEDNHPLRDFENVVITPHMGFYSVEAEEELQTRAARAVADALEHRQPENVVNPEVYS